MIDDHQRANDELSSANEELTSTNEELQSLNEELETAKEELQSSNEELTTLNEELETRNAELATANSDLLNVLGSVEVPIVIVDGARRIRRFTPKARPILNLLASDIGRPIGDIRPSIAIDLDAEIGQVLETVTMTETEARDRDGRWYRVQIRPYTTVDKRIDGAVISIVDIDVLKQAVSAAEWARDYARATVEAVQLPLALLDEHARIVSVNEAFTAQLGGQVPQLVGHRLYDIMEDGHGRIEVTDRGVGIAPAFLSHLFDPFSQADQTHTRKHGGLGLGLALVHYLVEAHGGTIEVTSPGLGEGATFTVRIPLWIGASAVTPEPARPARTIRGTRILVVEDDPQTRDAVAQMLAIAGAEVQTAASAAEAIRVFEQFRPAILVSDIGMPEEDGCSLLRRIRALGPERGGDLPALALTAFAAEEDRLRAIDAGFQLHAAKPIDAERLIQAIASLTP